MNTILTDTDQTDIITADHVGVGMQLRLPDGHDPIPWDDEHPGAFEPGATYSVRSAYSERPRNITPTDDVWDEIQASAADLAMDFDEVVRHSDDPDEDAVPVGLAWAKHLLDTVLGEARYKISFYEGGTITVPPTQEFA